MVTKRTKHNYISQMTAGNFEDKMALLNTVSLRNEYRERTAYSRTAERKQIYLRPIYRMMAGILKTK